MASYFPSDLPRDPINRVTIISDPRNDENMMIAGLQSACLLFQEETILDRALSRVPEFTLA
jgi:hypothetical protein